MEAVVGRCWGPDFPNPVGSLPRLLSASLPFLLWIMCLPPFFSVILRRLYTCLYKILSSIVTQQSKNKTNTGKPLELVQNVVHIPNCMFKRDQSSSPAPPPRLLGPRPCRLWLGRVRCRLLLGWVSPTCRERSRDVAVDPVRAGSSVTSEPVGQPP